MKTLLLICLICISVSSLAEVEIYSDVSHGPFKGYEHQYLVDRNECLSNLEVNDKK